MDVECSPPFLLDLSVLSFLFIGIVIVVRVKPMWLKAEDLIPIKVTFLT